MPDVDALTAALAFRHIARPRYAGVSPPSRDASMRRLRAAESGLMLRDFMRTFRARRARYVRWLTLLGHRGRRTMPRADRAFYRDE